MKIVVFGAGRFYQRRKEEFLFSTDDELVAIIDNNQEIHGKEMDGIPVLAVEKIRTLDFDLVVLMSARADDMKTQLVQLGVDTKKIWYWGRYESKKKIEAFCLHCRDTMDFAGRKRILVILQSFGYHGGALTAVYAAKALKQRNYHVVLMASGGNQTFIDEMEKQGLNILICSALPYLYMEERAFIEQFDAVIVNVFPMILCAVEISKQKPVIWWIHEASISYKETLVQFSEYAKTEQMDRMDIYGVSRIAQDNFNYYFPNRITKTLAYGIPDELKDMDRKDKEAPVVFAIIGVVMPLKAQDLFLEAVKHMREELKSKAEFWIIGFLGQDSYSNKIKEMVSNETSAALLGEMTRREIQNAFEEIDVLVCPSVEDSLPIVVTEALMYGKVCIVSDSVGMADYITEGKNGFVFPKGNRKALSEKMEWMIENREQLWQIGQNARQTYEDHFTLECFGERLEEILYDAMEKRRRFTEN